MKGDIFINEKDAWDTWGVRMGDGFLDAIDGFNEMKDYIEDESRLEHGKRVITENAKVDSREVTLQFTIEGNLENDYRSKKKAFQTELGVSPTFTTNVTLRLYFHRNIHKLNL